MGRATNSTLATDAFAQVMGSRRGLRPEQEGERKLSRMSANELREREAFEEDMRRDRERQQAAYEKGQRIRAAVMSIVGEREVWEPEDLREAARGKLAPEDHDWVATIVMDMCGDGGALATTSRFKIHKA
jgi:hypothetical protein